MVSILVVDDHMVVRRGLTQILQEEFRGITFSEAATPSEALLLVRKRSWDLIILDISLPGKDGLELLPDILKIRSGARVLMLSMHAHQPFAARSQELGASGFVSKSDSRAQLVKAIANVLAGKRYFPRLAGAVASGGAVARPQSAHRPLSARERAVMQMLASGKRLSEVAAQLGVSVKTISTYKRRILLKMGWTSTVDMARYIDREHDEPPPMRAPARAVANPACSSARSGGDDALRSDRATEPDDDSKFF